MSVPSINLEMMLAGWTDSHSGGAKVTFWLPDADALESFKEMTARKGNTAGQRFMAVLVMLGDDETPQPIPKKEPAKEKIGPLALLAVQLCKNPEFTKWLRPIYCKWTGGDGKSWGDVTPELDFDGSWERWTRHAILVLCECHESRRELDTDPLVAARFESVIRKPWMESQR